MERSLRRAKVSSVIPVLAPTTNAMRDCRVWRRISLLGEDAR
jgi:hypothetical protein